MRREIFQKISPTIFFLAALFGQTSHAEENASALGRIVEGFQGLVKGPLQNRSCYPSSVNPTAPKFEQVCSRQMNEWLKKYAAGSPFAAHNKVSDIRYNPETFEKESSTKGPDWSDSLPKPRDKEIVQNVERLLGDHKKTGNRTLLIVYAGATHIEDYFLKHPDENILYSSMPLSEKIAFHSDAYRRFWHAYMIDDSEQALKRLKGQRERLERLSSTPTTAPRIQELIDKIKREETKTKKNLDDAQISELAATQHHEFLLQSATKRISARRIMGEKIPSKERIFQESAVAPNPRPVIMISDYHGDNTTSLSDELPSGQCLRSLGFDRIEFAAEPYAFGKDFSPKEAIELATGDAQKHLPYLETHYPDVAAEVRAGEAILFPNYLAMIKKMQDYEKSGLKVRYTGVETK